MVTLRWCWSQGAYDSITCAGRSGDRVAEPPLFAYVSVRRYHRHNGIVLYGWLQWGTQPNHFKRLPLLLLLLPRRQSSLPLFTHSVVLRTSLRDAGSTLTASGTFRRYPFWQSGTRRIASLFSSYSAAPAAPADEGIDASVIYETIGGIEEKISGKVGVV